MAFKKQLLISIGIPSAIGLILIVGIFYLASDIGDLGNKIYQTRKDINFGTQAEESLIPMRQDYEQAKMYFSEVGGILPNKNQLLGLSKDLNIMARQNQISLSLNIGQESSGGANQLTEIGLSVSGQGTFEGLLNFLKTVENSRYFIKFSSLDLQKSDNNKASLNLNGKIISL